MILNLDEMLHLKWKRTKRKGAESVKNESKIFGFYKNKTALCRPKQREGLTNLRNWKKAEVTSFRPSFFSRVSDWLINTSHIWLVYFYPIPNWPAPARRWFRWEMWMQGICFMSNLLKPSIRAEERWNARGMIDWVIRISATKIETEKCSNVYWISVSSLVRLTFNQFIFCNLNTETVGITAFKLLR